MRYGAEARPTSLLMQVVEYSDTAISDTDKFSSRRLDLLRKVMKANITLKKFILVSIVPHSAINSGGRVTLMSKCFGNMNENEDASW